MSKNQKTDIKKLKKGIDFKKCRPMADRIVVKPLPAETKTAGGIIIPDSAKEKPLRGEVMIIGPGVSDSTVIPNNHVLYGKYGGTEIELDGQPYLMMKESEVFCTFDMQEEVEA